jgi:hypothetical protein
MYYAKLKLGEEFIDTLQTQAIPTGRKTAKLQLHDELMPPPPPFKYKLILQVELINQSEILNKQLVVNIFLTKIETENRNLSKL